jgi:hypothetical protein
MSEAHNSLDAAALSAAEATRGQPLDHRAEAIEHALGVELDRIATKSVLFEAGDIDPTTPAAGGFPRGDKRLLMGQDPRLPAMPDKPTLLDFFKYRFRPTQHLMQSARLALKAGYSEKVVLACLLHDIAVIGFIRCDHGYWAAQLLEPYVDEEVSWAIRYHQALRFFPDEAAGYEYPELYVRFFGADYNPPAYIHRDHEIAKKHRWYDTSRAITVNDLYAFDPDVTVQMDDFVDIIGRNFRQPQEGLGYDASPAAHMWRTMIAPTRAL